MFFTEKQQLLIVSVFVVCHVFYALMHLLCLADLQSAAMDKLYYYVLQTDWMIIRWLPDCKQKSKELLRDCSLREVILTCDIDVDWANNKEIADADNDDKEGGDDSLNDNDLDLNIDNEEEDEREDDAFYFSNPEQVFVVCIIDCQLL
jgi:hypothetical protein